MIDYWRLRCPVCHCYLSPEGRLLIDQMTRLSRHLASLHPFELALLRVALSPPARPHDDGQGVDVLVGAPHA